MTPLSGPVPRLSLSTGASWLLKITSFACFAMIALVVLSDPRVMALLPGGDGAKSATTAQTQAPARSYTEQEAAAGTAYLAMLGRFATYTAGEPALPISALASAAALAPVASPAPNLAATQFDPARPVHKPTVSRLPASRVKIRRVGQ